MVRTTEQSEGLQECKDVQDAGMTEYKGQREKGLCTFDENSGFRKCCVYPVSQGNKIF